MINPIFATSEGWKLINPKFIQRFAPPSEAPITVTEANKIITTMYIKLSNFLYIL